MLSQINAAAAVNAPGLLSPSNLCSWLMLLLLLPIATAALSHFLQMTFEKGMIFRKYYALITYWFWFRPRKKQRKESNLNNDWVLGDSTEPMFELAPRKTIVLRKQLWYSWFYKPLGGCIYCNGTWIAIFCYCLLMYNQNTAFIPKAEGLFLFIGVNYIWIKILSKVVE